MLKKPLTERLALLNGGRRHYLDFLRNLAPQSALLAFALILMVRIDFTRFDLSNTGPTLLFFILVGAAVLAFYANSTLFYEGGFPEWISWVKEQEVALKKAGVTKRMFIPSMLRAVWQHRLIEFFEVLLAIGFLQIALSIVIVLSLHSASGMLKSKKADTQPEMHTESARHTSCLSSAGKGNTAPSLSDLTGWPSRHQQASLIGSLRASQSGSAYLGH